MLYKPEWVKWRFHKKGNTSKALVYQLLEGTNFLFEDISAELIQFLLNIKSWSEIDKGLIQKRFPFISLIDLNSFLDELTNNGILTDYIPEYSQIKEMRKKVGQYRIDLEKSRDLISENETKKKLPFFQSDPETEYAATQSGILPRFLLTSLYQLIIFAVLV